MSTQKLPYQQALQAAGMLQVNLHAWCHRIEVAGSLRRLQAMPESARPAGASARDIEILAIPRFESQEDLFGKTVATDNLLWARVEVIFEPWPAPRAWGPKFRRIALPLPGENGRAVMAEIYTATYRTWPVLLVIRTGDKDFSRAMVTSVDKGGLLPADCYVEGGRLYRAGRAVEIFSESQVFREWKLPWVPPWKRTARAAAWLRRRVLKAVPA